MIRSDLIAPYTNTHTIMWPANGIWSRALPENEKREGKKERITEEEEE